MWLLAGFVYILWAPISQGWQPEHCPLVGAIQMAVQGYLPSFLFPESLPMALQFLTAELEVSCEAIGLSAARDFLLWAVGVVTVCGSYWGVQRPKPLNNV